MVEKRINVAFHVSGSITSTGDVTYKGGRLVMFIDVDCDLFGYFTLS